MDSEGRTTCGGEGCGGVVTTASSVWNKAHESEREILSAMGEVEKLSRMVSPVLVPVSVTVVQILTCSLSSGVGGQAAGGRGEAERSGRPHEDQHHQTEGGPEQRGAEEPHQRHQRLPDTYVHFLFDQGTSCC